MQPPAVRAPAARSCVEAAVKPVLGGAGARAPGPMAPVESQQVVEVKQDETPGSRASDEEVEVARSRLLEIVRRSLKMGGMNRDLGEHALNVVEKMVAAGHGRGDGWEAWMKDDGGDDAHAGRVLGGQGTAGGQETARVPKAGWGPQQVADVSACKEPNVRMQSTDVAWEPVPGPLVFDRHGKKSCTVISGRPRPSVQPNLSSVEESVSGLP